jgi:hypothetical protein
VPGTDSHNFFTDFHGETGRGRTEFWLPVFFCLRGCLSRTRAASPSWCTACLDHEDRTPPSVGEPDTKRLIRLKQRDGEEYKEEVPLLSHDRRTQRVRTIATEQMPANVEEAWNDVNCQPNGIMMMEWITRRSPSPQSRR